MRKTYPVRLRLPDDRAGDALSIRHLTERLEAMTGVPSYRQVFVINGNAKAALKQETMKSRPETPLHLVGITNKVKLHMYGTTAEPWNDEGWLRLQEVERTYDQLKQTMNRTLHAMKVLNGGNPSQERRLATSLLGIRHEIHTLKSTATKTPVLCTANQSKADKLKERLFSNMAKRLEEIEAVIFAIQQAGVTKQGYL